MAPHSSTPAWKIPWTEEPGRLQSMGSLRVRHDRATSFSLFTFMPIGEGNGNPLQCSCLENPRDGGAWWASVYGVAQNQTPLKRLSSSSSSSRWVHNKENFQDYKLNLNNYQLNPNDCSKWYMIQSVTKSCLTLCDPMDYSLQAPLSMGFPRQDYGSGLPCPPPGDLPKPGIEPSSPTLAGRFFTTSIT